MNLPSPNAPRLPPRQQWAAADKWPVVGERVPRESTEPWTITIAGCVEQPVTLSLSELQAMPSVEQQLDIHCVTRWSKPDVRFRGVLLADLLAIAKPLAHARFVQFIARSPREHDTSLPLADALSLGTLLAWEADGQPLTAIHGGPVRTITPGRYFYKSLKWLERIEILVDDRLGYWERTAGYHNEADPWREQRYIAAGLSRDETQQLLQSKQLSGRDLLNFSAAGLDLTGLQARGALLRNADFRGCCLLNADFSQANLTNARFENADLRNVNFRDADLEGADFTGANLSGVDFHGASLLAATLP